MADVKLGEVHIETAPEYAEELRKLNSAAIRRWIVKACRWYNKQTNPELWEAGQYEVNVPHGWINAHMPTVGNKAGDFDIEGFEEGMYHQTYEPDDESGEGVDVGVSLLNSYGDFLSADEDWEHNYGEPGVSHLEYTMDLQAVWEHKYVNATQYSSTCIWLAPKGTEEPPPPKPLLEPSNN